MSKLYLKTYKLMLHKITCQHTILQNITRHFYCLAPISKGKQLEKGKCKSIAHKAKANNSFGPNNHFPLFLGVQIISMEPIT